ncbi:MAG TPA: LPS export ABC transporter periplasmic protein LptC [Stellaceae bacterium]|jgi:lipopolysaccharide export system protein LptC|nr:LPS export ABC transporter periplasmic protein LptC [Stellaceae bacterium]
MSARQADSTTEALRALRRRLHFGDTRSHSRFVQRSKWILPSLAVTLLLLVATWPQLKSVVDRLHFSAPRIDVSDARNLRMVDPRYSGIDKQNRPYVLTASTATQASGSDDIVSLAAPKADMTTNSGNWVEVTSYTGTYQPQPQLLDLYGDVELYQDRGNEFHTDSARIDIADGTAKSDQPMSGQGPFGHVTAADGFTMLDRGAVIQFNGKTNLTLLPRPKDAE